MTQTPGGAAAAPPPGAEADRDFRWNASLLIAEGAAFMFGLAFFDSSTVYPVLLAKLGAPDMLIGVARLVQTLGYTLPALFAAHYIHGRARHKSFLLATCTVSRVGLFTIPIALTLFGESRPGVALAWTMSVAGLFWLADGACAISWFDIVAKSIPARVRGRFFGLMQTVAGLLAIGAGLMVREILVSPSLRFPTNFALLAGLWFLGAMGSQLGLAMLREPPGPAKPADERPTLVVYLRQATPLLRRSPRLRQLITVRLLLDGAGLAAPFYVLFAQRDLGVPLPMVGVYTIAQHIGRVATGPAWGWISDRCGTTWGVRGIAMAVVATPLAALGALHISPWLMVAVFLLLGAVMDGIWMVMSTALLESVSEEDRPLAVGVASVCQTPSAAYAPIGGVLASVTSYRVVFGAALTFASAGAVAASLVGPVRRQSSA